MSQGRKTQRMVDIMMWVTCAVAAIGVVLLATYELRNYGFAFLGLAILISLMPLLLRCKSCGLGVTKEADGLRTEKRTWPRVNPACRKCGADIP